MFHTLISICEGGRGFLAPSRAIVHRPPSVPDICPRLMIGSVLTAIAIIHRGTTPLEAEGHCANFPPPSGVGIRVGAGGGDAKGLWEIGWSPEGDAEENTAASRVRVEQRRYLIAQTAHARACIYSAHGNTSSSVDYSLSHSTEIEGESEREGEAGSIFIPVETNSLEWSARSAHDTSEIATTGIHNNPPWIEDARLRTRHADSLPLYQLGGFHSTQNPARFHGCETRSRLAQFRSWRLVKSNGYSPSPPPPPPPSRTQLPCMYARGCVHAPTLCSVLSTDPAFTNKPWPVMDILVGDWIMSSGVEMLNVIRGCSRDTGVNA